MVNKMKNNLSVDEIKNSVEYQWRKHHIKINLYIWLLISCITLFIPFVIAIKNFEYIGTGLIAWIGFVVFYGLIIGAFILYYVHKNKYLLKNYKNFNTYEVFLDKLSTSFAYKGAIYYKVNVDGRQVDTNPYFSNMFLSKFSPEDFNNKKVLGLYDEEMDKFYIIKLI